MFLFPISHLQRPGEQLCVSQIKCIYVVVVFVSCFSLQFLICKVWESSCVWVRASVAATLLDLATTTSSSPTVEGVTTCEHMSSPNWSDIFLYHPSICIPVFKQRQNYKMRHNWPGVEKKQNHQFSCLTQISKHDNIGLELSRSFLFGEIANIDSKMISERQKMKEPSAGGLNLRQWAPSSFFGCNQLLPLLASPSQKNMCWSKGADSFSFFTCFF